MTTKTILKGLKFRLQDLEEAYEILAPNQEIADRIKADFEVRIDEIEGLIYWIEGKNGN